MDESSYLLLMVILIGAGLVIYFGGTAITATTKEGLCTACEEPLKTSSPEKEAPAPEPEPEPESAPSETKKPRASYLPAHDDEKLNIYMRKQARNTIAKQSESPTKA